MDLIHFLLLSTTCLSVSYLAFRLIFEKELRFHQQRIFLIGAVALSLLLPVTGIRIDFVRFSGSTVESVSYFQPSATNGIQQPVSTPERGFFFGKSDMLIQLYKIIAIFFIAFIVIQFIKILWLYFISKRTHNDKGVILCNKSIRSPFSFFRWIFIPEGISDSEERESIIIHESIHVSQCHSFDNLLIELIAAVMWFNPLVWFMKKSLHLVHEYLADEGTLGTGVDRFRYQALLINQVTEERLICLSSSFNNSLIKKRMIMMTKSKTNRQNKLKILTLLPLSGILFLMVGLLNGLFPGELKAGGTETNAVSPANLKSSAGILMQKDTTKNKTVKVKVDVVKKADVKEKVAVREKVDVIEKVDVVENVDVDDKVDVMKNADVTIDVDPGDIEVRVVIDSKPPDSLIYIIDGVHVKQIKDIDPENIESVNVMKEDNLIVIRTKEKAGNQAAGKASRGKVAILPDNLLYIVDGVTVDKIDFEKIDPDQIESISVIKGKEETSKYTDKDYEGIIKVITKAK